MGIAKVRAILVPFVTFVIIIASSIAVIAYGRGYRLDFSRQALSTTGLLAVTSDPTSAQVLVDGELTTVTNDTVNLSPDWYEVTVEKEGFQSWRKRVRVQGEVVTAADAYLFPTTPSLSVLSPNSVVRPVLSPDGTQLAFITPREDGINDATGVDRSGIWVLNVSTNLLAFTRDARQIMDSSILNLTTGNLVWSPDSSQLVVEVAHPITGVLNYYVLDATQTNDTVTPVRDLDELAAEWDLLEETLETGATINLKQDILRVATSSAQILGFTEDETKMLYEATASTNIAKVIVPPLIGTNPTQEARDIIPGHIYVYDIKEDRNYHIGEKTTFGFTQFVPEDGETPNSIIRRLRESEQPRPLQWLPTNRHLIVSGTNTIDVLEYDGIQRHTIYSGPFENGYVFPWGNASKILILSNFNPSASSQSTLYSVNLR